MPASADGTQPAASSSPLSLELIDSAGSVVFSLSRTPPSEMEDWILFQQIPLYTQGNVPLPPGTYGAVARLKTESGEVVSSAERTLEIE